MGRVARQANGLRETACVFVVVHVVALVLVVLAGLLLPGGVVESQRIAENVMTDVNCTVEEVLDVVNCHSDTSERCADLLVAYTEYNDGSRRIHGALFDFMDSCFEFGGDIVPLCTQLVRAVPGQTTFACEVDPNDNMRVLLKGGATRLTANGEAMIMLLVPLFFLLASVFSWMRLLLASGTDGADGRGCNLCNPAAYTANDITLIPIYPRLGDENEKILLHRDGGVRLKPAPASSVPRRVPWLQTLPARFRTRTIVQLLTASEATHAVSRFSSSEASRRRAVERLRRGGPPVVEPSVAAGSTEGETLQWFGSPGRDNRARALAVSLDTFGWLLISGAGIAFICYWEAYMAMGGVIILLMGSIFARFSQLMLLTGVDAFRHGGENVVYALTNRRLVSIQVCSASPWMRLLSCRAGSFGGEPDYAQVMDVPYSDIVAWQRAFGVEPSTTPERAWPPFGEATAPVATVRPLGDADQWRARGGAGRDMRTHEALSQIALWRLLDHAGALRVLNEQLEAARRAEDPAESDGEGDGGGTGDNRQGCGTGDNDAADKAAVAVEVVPSTPTDADDASLLKGASAL